MVLTIIDGSQGGWLATSVRGLSSQIFTGWLLDKGVGRAVV
jgi:hypothetical protein